MSWSVRAAHPQPPFSLQDLPDPVYDASKVQLPHSGTALHDEAGDTLSQGWGVLCRVHYSGVECLPSM